MLFCPLITAHRLALNGDVHATNAKSSSQRRRRKETKSGERTQQTGFGSYF